MKKKCYMKGYWMEVGKSDKFRKENRIMFLTMKGKSIFEHVTSLLMANLPLQSLLLM